MLPPVAQHTQWRYCCFSARFCSSAFMHMVPAGHAGHAAAADLAAASGGGVHRRRRHGSHDAGADAAPGPPQHCGLPGGDQYVAGFTVRTSEIADAQKISMSCARHRGARRVVLRQPARQPTCGAATCTYAPPVRQPSRKQINRRADGGSAHAVHQAVSGGGLFALALVTKLQSLNLSSCLELGDDDPLAALRHLTGLAAQHLNN